jgi:hypothetical protein
LDELIARKVIRTRNAPISDYAEWLGAKQLKLVLKNSSTTGYDATDKSGVRYQIKCRRLEGPGSRQLGVIRDIKKMPFDYLIAILFDKNFEVAEAYRMPIGVVKRYSKYSRHQRGNILYLRGPVLLDKQTRSITNRFRDS